MKHNARIRTVLLLTAVCLLITVLGIAFREKKSAIVVSHDEAPAPATDAEVELNNVSYSTLGADNFKLWDLNAVKARVFDEGKKLILDGVEITFYQRSGASYRLAAAHGELDMETRNLRISGGLKAILPDNATIETQSAHYDNAARIITTDDPITITRGPLVMKGVGMIADLSTETVTLLKNVNVAGKQ